MDTKLVQKYVDQYNLGKLENFENEINAFSGQVAGQWKKGISLSILKCGLHFEAASRSPDLFGKLFTSLMIIGDTSMANLVKQVSNKVWGVLIKVNKDTLEVSQSYSRNLYDKITTAEREEFMALLANGGAREIGKLVTKERANGKSTKASKSIDKSNNIYQTFSHDIGNNLTKVLAEKGDKDEHLVVWLEKLEALNKEIEDYLSSPEIKGALADKLVDPVNQDDNTAANSDEPTYKLVAAS